LTYSLSATSSRNLNVGHSKENVIAIVKWKMGALHHRIRAERERRARFCAHPFPAVEDLKSFEEG